MDTDRTTRLAAFRGVKAITAELRGTKLHDAEAAVIDQAAEDLLLATSIDGEDARQAVAAVRTLLDDLSKHRWAEHGQTADRLRDLMDGCAPEPAVRAGS
ncbi:MAG: hypothetical protein QOH46_2999 [Solirubrobacteraceae bacterium]|jgi:hypothetical protein|nr:hypothetical protein [Solirubrobacteraceae bacterium]